MATPNSYMIRREVIKITTPTPIILLYFAIQPPITKARMGVSKAMIMSWKMKMIMKLRVNLMEMAGTRMIMRL